MIFSKKIFFLAALVIVSQTYQAKDCKPGSEHSQKKQVHAEKIREERKALKAHRNDPNDTFKGNDYLERRAIRHRRAAEESKEKAEIEECHKHTGRADHKERKADKLERKAQREEERAKELEEKAKKAERKADRYEKRARADKKEDRKFHRNN